MTLRSFLSLWGEKIGNEVKSMDIKEDVIFVGMHTQATKASHDRLQWCRIEVLR
jgi:hypothetical protein